MNNNLVSIALYRPHPGMEELLRELLKKHEPALRDENLITEYPLFLPGKPLLHLMDQSKM